MQFFLLGTIICAHNIHIGNARATDMSKDNIIILGQLVREWKKKNKYSIDWIWNI
jgi:erythromycin esterase-like protein